MQIRWWAVAVLALALALPVPSAHGVQPRIIGGSSVEITQVPWQVLIIVNGNRQCAGAIIADQWILTAAHCVDAVALSQVRVFSGITQVSDRGQELPLANVVVHPQWNAQAYANDVALIQLAVPITFSDRQRPIALPDGIDTSAWPAAGTEATIAGWGATAIGGSASNALQQASVNILAGPSDGVCGTYGERFDPLAQICAGVTTGGIDACQGDSGGALVVSVDGRPTIAGLVSTGIECALAEYPGQYTRVTTYLPWIRQYAAPPTFAPASPSAAMAEALTKGRVLVQWQPPTIDGGSPIQRYVAEVSPGGQRCETAELRCVIRGLVPGRRYSVSVVAVNGVGASVATNAITVTAVDRIARVGRSILIAKSGKRVTVRPNSRAVCRADARRVVLRAPGVCRAMSAGSLTVIQVLARPVVES